METIIPNLSLAGRRVAVALSGGVDSAATAALLKKSGAEVTALTMLLQKTDRPDDAVRVAAALDIKLHIIDLTDRFASCVMSDFAATYARGQTPNPCVLCNRAIKFGDLMQAARAGGAQALATGHYARRFENAGRAELHSACDLTRDQSYFLFALSQEQIDFARFPLGHLSKDQTRALAASFNLPVADKPDSQDICFVPGGNYAALVQKLNPTAARPGEIVDQQGRVLGRHQGLIHFTIGQRRGLALGNRTGDQNEPLFVVRLDAQSNQVVVGPRAALAKNRVYVRDVNWLGPTLAAGQGVPVAVKLRSTQGAQGAHIIFLESGRAVIELDEPAYGITPGQAAVAYHDTHLLGGGWIEG